MGGLRSASELRAENERKRQAMEEAFRKMGDKSGVGQATVHRDAQGRRCARHGYQPPVFFVFHVVSVCSPCFAFAMTQYVELFHFLHAPCGCTLTRARASFDISSNQNPIFFLVFNTCIV